MGLFNRSDLGARTMIKITDDGGKALHSEVVDRVDDYAVLSALDQHSPRSLSDLAKEANMNVFACKKTVERLQRQGMVVTIDYNNRGE